MLYAQCTSCEAIFQVNASQLSAHQGLVRCGNCDSVFNAAATIMDRLPEQIPRVEPVTTEAKPAATPPPSPPPSAPPPTLTPTSPPPPAPTPLPPTPTAPPPSPPPPPSAPIPAPPASPPSPPPTTQAALPILAEMPGAFMHNDPSQTAAERIALEPTAAIGASAPPATPSSTPAPSPPPPTPSPSPSASPSTASTPSPSPPPAKKPRALDAMRMDDDPTLHEFGDEDDLPHRHRRGIKSRSLHKRKLFQRRSRGRRFAGFLLWLIVTGALLAAAAWQVRANYLATLSQFAPLRPALALFCRAAECKLPERMNLNAIVVDKLRVTAHPDIPGALSLRAEAINNAWFNQPWPNIRLSQYNQSGHLLARRTIPWPNQNPDAQMQSGKEYVLQLVLLEPPVDAVRFEVGVGRP